MVDHTDAYLIGVKVNAVSIDSAVQSIHSWISDNRKQYICVTPAHAVMDCYHAPELRKIYNASGLSTPDGMAIVWYLRWKGFHNIERVYGPDLLLAVCESSIKTGYRHYFYGGAPGIAKKLAENLQRLYPGIQVAGCWSPPFRTLSPEEDQADIDRINAANADVVWVGLGSPKQELWMSAHRDRLNAPVLIGVGAAFDFLSGNKKQAPRWIQRSGFEWFYRLLQEPGRLWKRYIWYPFFVILVIAQELGVLKFKGPNSPI